MRSRQILFSLAIGAVLATTARAQDPGIAIPTTSEASAQKQGAVLFYAYYTSDTGNLSLEDTRFTLTNGDVNPQRVHVFFVNGQSGAVSDEFICLGGNQTTSLQTSSLAPNVNGYVVAVAVNGTTGCPIGTEGNALSGMVHVKRADGFRGSLPAIAVSALYAGSIAGCSGATPTASMPFNGVSYNLLPRVVAVDHLPSRADGRNTLLVVNRTSGNLAGTASALGKLAGSMYDDAENKAGWVLPVATTQLETEIRNGVPTIPPPVETFIPAGRTGWTRFRSYPTDFGLLGAAFSLDPTGSYNLKANTLSGATSITVPVSAPGC